MNDPAGRTRRADMVTPEVDIDPIDPTGYPPHVKIEQVGRWTYRITVHHQLLMWTYGHALGRRRAERKARRALSWYLRMQQREARTAVITMNDIATNRQEQP
jgi:hypothetical protein